MSIPHATGYAVLIIVAIFLAGIFGAGLRLITQETPSPPEAQTDARVYVVKRGDALGAISERTGVSTDRMMALNPKLDPLALVPGQRIRLQPVSRAERAKARRRQRALPRRYVVKKGDSPSGVAEKTGVPLYRLLSLNKGIDRKPIVPGQRLRIRK
jgi:LysM repeat protein